MRKLIVILGVTTSLLCSCSAQDEDNFPYRMKGLNVWVYDSASEKDIFVGFTEADYSSRERGLASCSNLATSAATSWNLKQWSYVCCTVTEKSQCATKVR